jgi:hypothetical protein
MAARDGRRRARRRPYRRVRNAAPGRSGYVNRDATKRGGHGVPPQASVYLIDRLADELRLVDRVPPPAHTTKNG